MRLRITDLGSSFTVEPVNDGNTHRPSVHSRTFKVRPGVYRLCRRGVTSGAEANAEYFAPPSADNRPAAVWHKPHDVVVEGEDSKVEAACSADDARLTLCCKASRSWRRLPMRRTKAYTYDGSLPASVIRTASLEYAIAMEHEGKVIGFPTARTGWPGSDAESSAALDRGPWRVVLDRGVITELTHPPTKQRRVADSGPGELAGLRAWSGEGIEPGTAERAEAVEGEVRLRGNGAELATAVRRDGEDLVITQHGSREARGVAGIRDAACEGLEMIRGDATTAYADMLKRFHREVVYLKPNCFILYDDIVTNDARTQRHFEWLLHSVAPMVDLGGRIEIRGAKATLVVDPLLPQPAYYKFPEGRFTGSRSNPVRVHCLSLRQDWQHLWNVTPGDSPYPQWDARRLEPLFGPRYRYLVVLTALRAGDSNTPCAELVPVEEGVGVQLTSGERVDTVIFNPNKKIVRLVGIETDGEKAVVREQRGEVTSWSVVRGRILCHRDRTLLNSKRAMSRAEDCRE